MNFPAGKRNRKWDPSEDWYREAALLEVLEPTAPPCCCTYIIYMQSTGKGAHGAVALILHWGPSPLTSLQHAAGEVIRVCIQLVKWAVYLVLCVGCWTQNRVRRVISIGLRRGHMCIQEGFNLESLFLSLSPRVRVPVNHSSSSSFSLPYWSENAVLRAKHLCLLRT